MTVWKTFNDSTTILMILLKMTILITIYTGDVTYNDRTYNWLYLWLIILIKDSSITIKKYISNVEFFRYNKLSRYK